MHKAGRNDSCPCGSGKKYKKCCETKFKHKKIQAEVISASQAPKMASLFQRHVAPPPASHPEPPENVTM